MTMDLLKADKGEHNSMAKEKEYFRVRAYIDEEALRRNIRTVRQKIGPDVLMLGTVKANAYGHGAERVARILQEEGADYLSTAILEEAVSLREAGAELPILVLGYTDPSQYDLALEHRIHLTIFSEQQAQVLSQKAAAGGKIGRIHLKLDTGMGRIGFACSGSSVDAIERIARLPNLSLDGIFTHFARADEEDKSEAARQQQRYDDMLERIEARGIHIPIHHTANSAAIMEYPQAHRLRIEKNSAVSWMVRAGIMLYGLYPSGEMDRQQTKLYPVLSLISHVVHVKEVEDGTPIGYGGTYVAKGCRRIATIPVGYADGYPRRLSGIGYIKIRGQRAPIAGRICMDQFMADVTDIPEVSVGDEVELIGTDVTAEEIAELTGTIHYELICQLTARVPRVSK